MSLQKIWIDQLKANKVPVTHKEENDIIWLDSFPKGHEWIVNMEQTKKCRTQTMTGYASCFRRFCEQVKMTPDDLITYARAGNSVKILLRDEAPKILAYKKGVGRRWVLSNTPISDNTLHSIQIAVCSFMSNNAMGIGKFPFAQPPTPKVPVSTMADILEMEKNAENARDRAILWFFASTGFRPETATKLMWKDLQDAKPIVPNNAQIPIAIIIDPSRSKGKGLGGYKNAWTVTFLHDYAWKFIEDYKNMIKPNPDDPLFKTNEGEIKFITYEEVDALEAIFKRLRRRTFGRQKDKQFTPMSFRHFAQRCYTNAKVDAIDKNALVGHVIRDPSNPYVRTNVDIIDPDVQTIRDSYAMALKYLKP